MLVAIVVYFLWLRKEDARFQNMFLALWVLSPCLLLHARMAPPTACSWRWHHWRAVTLASGKLLSYCGPAPRLEHLPKLLAPMRRVAPTSAPGPDLKLKLSMLYLNAVSSVSRALRKKKTQCCLSGC